MIWPLEFFKLARNSHITVPFCLHRCLRFADTKLLLSRETRYIINGSLIGIIPSPSAKASR